MNNRFLSALACQPVDSKPIWLMRQAGRYLPEYREIRAQVKDFMGLCQTPELACEVTLQPLARFDLDAAIIFSDILTIPDAMGLGLYFTPGEGPAFTHPVQDERAIQRLGVPDPQENLGYVMDAIRLTKQALAGRVPLIGFSGSPWTLATYMVEGKSSKQFNMVRAMAYKAPHLMHHLLAILTQAVTDYLLAQVAAGADAVMLFDSWGGLLSPTLYQQLSLAPMQTIITALRQRYPELPVICFTKGGGNWLGDLAKIGASALGIDWMTDLAYAKKTVGPNIALQGNLDPAALYGSPTQVRAAVTAVLEAFGRDPGHIFNLGHGIYPDTPIDSVHTLIQTVREFA